MTETLANLNILWILALVASLTVLRLVLIRLPSPTARTLAELSETGLTAVALVFLILRPFFMQAFYIPTASMEATLQGNSRTKDRILVSKLQYRLHPPRRNDVVVFLAPPAAMPGDPPFVKRLVGLPGDRLETVAGFVMANGRRYGHADVRAALGASGELGPQAQADGYVDQADHHVKFVADGVLADKRPIGKQRLAEILTGMAHAPVTVSPGCNIRNGVKLAEPFIAEDPDYDYKFVHGQPLKHDYDPPVPDLEYRRTLDATAAVSGISKAQYRHDVQMPTEPLPAGHYLMMGDNRNDSNDGTNWGPLESWRVVGPARLVFWPPADMGVVR